ncbi:bifunctional 2-polyprenyl-6-hydroxyphenol methylase/3-demethylubiquinol 3-O-methyltransferase UbiG [Hydrogenimonas sp.]|uniref:class I SAM-dependent methyltransferase n=1 Tax=Hydrogenimonas sp. TaxID=2231112 RepID=UPI00260E32A9|nr:class I SAM-dependent methyltransferase [Hydrogenimonas sp.]
MIEDKLKWNEKYRSQPAPKHPSDLLIRHVEKLKGREVLDIAAGLGRHAQYLADHGCLVDAIEWSDVALESLKKIPRVNAIEADLEDGCFLTKKYDAILCFNYLNRNLYPVMLSHLKRGGILLFETFVEDDANEGSPQNPDFLLKKNELLHIFCPLYIIEYSEKFVTKENGQRSLLASLAACNSWNR